LKYKKEELPFINEKIIAPQVQLITHEGENIGVVSRQEALRRAVETELDLVVIAERGGEGVPVVKIMDFGKALYERKKKQAEAKKHQKVIQVKEIKMRPKIGEHDFQTKMKQAAQFLKEGKRVKLTLWFRGRENVLKDQHGSELFERIEKSFHGHGFSNLASEKETKLGQIWSRIYYLKHGK
jgi:translation initiation factor IF-3